MDFHEEVKKVAAIVETFVKLAKDKKWIQKSVKRPGRFKGWSLSKMKSRYNALKKKEDKTEAEISEMRALALGIRFKGGDVPGGKKTKGIKKKK